MFFKKKQKQNNTSYKKYITHFELDKLLKSFNEREEHIKLITMILAFVGLRLNEVVKINIADFSDDFKILNAGISKQKRVKKRVICESLAEYIKDYCRRNYNLFIDGYLFSSHNPASIGAGHKHISRDGYRLAFIRKCKQLGLTQVYFKNYKAKYHRITPHTLRHYFITTLLKNVDLQTVSQIIGHANTSTTFRYYYDPSVIGTEKRIVDKSFNLFFNLGYKLPSGQTTLNNFS